MNYTIIFLFPDGDFMESTLDGSTKIHEVIQFLVEGYPQLGQDQKRITITSQILNRRLNPASTIAQLLQNEISDTFIVEINRQSVILNSHDEQPPQRNSAQNIQNVNYQQSQSQSEGEHFKLTLQYQDQQVTCEIEKDTTLQELQEFAHEQLKIEGRVQMMSNFLNLSSFPSITKLKDTQLKDGSIISFVQTQLQNQVNQQQSLNGNTLQQGQQNQQLQYFQTQLYNEGKMVKLQIQIQDGDGTGKERACILNINSNQTLIDLEQEILKYIGIYKPSIAKTELFVGQQRMTAQKTNKSLHQLNLDHDNLIIIAKIQWQGG